MSDLRQLLTRSLALEGAHLRLVSVGPSLKETIEAVEDALEQARQISAIFDRLEAHLLTLREKLYALESEQSQ